MPGIDILKVLLPATLTFCVGIALTPLLTHYLYQFKVWKRAGGKTALADGQTATEFNRLHGERERQVPRMGGIVIWGSGLLTILALEIAGMFFPSTQPFELTFLSRAQTWIPLAALLVGGLFGALNDIYDVYGSGQGIRLRTRLLVIGALSIFIGWWFYAKLGVTALHVPLLGLWQIGFWIIPFFVLMTLFIYASGTIDGIDGLAGGVFTGVFAAYAGVALFNNQVDLAAFCAMLVGGILAFLWFNIPPARFFMTETGTMALTLSLATIVMMTDALADGYGVFLFPVAGLLLCVTVLATVLQITCRRVWGIRLLRIAPLHHHFEAIGWPSHKVTMRYWVISIITALATIALAGMGA
jgi:phospho-N-acetylmuramoyl-pentapeptide-transferase